MSRTKAAGGWFRRSGVPRQRKSDTDFPTVSRGREAAEPVVPRPLDALDLTVLKSRQGFLSGARFRSNPQHAYWLMLQTYVLPCLIGAVHSGPRSVVAFGTLIRTLGPALCCPLNGVGLFGLKPHAVAVLGSSNQIPTCRAWVGAKVTSGSKPKI